jgi:hypothetical protein
VRIRVPAVASLVLMSAFIGCTPTVADPFLLISAKGFDSYAATSSGVKEACPARLDEGLDDSAMRLVRPRIGTDALIAPFPLEVRFASAIEPASLRVRVTYRGWRTGFAAHTEDLTERIRPHASATGIHSDAVEVPFSGCYTVEIEARDARGRPVAAAFQARIDTSS